MKAIGTSIVILVLFALAGCGGSTVHIGGSPIGPFVFIVGQTSDNLFTFKGSDSGAISSMGAVSTGHAPSAVIMESLSSFQMNLFVTDSASNNLAVFNLDPSTGAVSSAGISMATGSNPIAIGLRPPSGIGAPNTPVDRGALYVLNQGSNSISGFQITDTSGHMTEVPGSPFATKANPQAMAVLNGSTSVANQVTFIYIANGALGTISGFKINADGSLTEVAGSPFAAGANISALTARSVGSILLASDSSANKVLGFRADAGGALTPLPGATLVTGTQPGALAFAFNDFVYVANRGSNNLSAFKFDFASSTLTPVSGSPFATGTTPVALGTTRPLQLYVADQGSSDITGFNIDQNSGALTPISGSPFHTPAPPSSIQTLFFMNVD
jgi:6-phosphogluconolactonase (cycloisomerase 2 family)